MDTEITVANYLAAWQQKIDSLIGYTVATHLKDAVGRYPNSRFALPGENEFDYADFALRLYEAGYNGYMTSEVSAAVSKSPDYDAYRAALTGDSSK